MGEHGKNYELNNKYQEILKGSDGFQRVEKFLDLLDFSLHKKNNLFEFFQIKKWVLKHFALGFKDKNLIERFKIFEKEGVYLKNKLLKEGDFIIDQMDIALDDLKSYFDNLENRLKEILLPKILLKIKPKQLIEDLRALRLLTKIRIRLFDLQKELGALNATMSKKKNMFLRFREFSKEVNITRSNLLEKIVCKIESSFFKEFEKKICLKTYSIINEGQSLVLIDEINKRRAILEAMCLSKAKSNVFFSRLDTFMSICKECLEKQRQAYLENKVSHDEKKSQFELRILKDKNLDLLFEEIQRSNLFNVLKKELLDKIIFLNSQKIRNKERIYRESKQKKNIVLQEQKIQASKLIEAIEQSLSVGQQKSLDEIASVISSFEVKRELLTNKLDSIRFDHALQGLNRFYIAKESKACLIQEKRVWLNERMKYYKELKIKGSLSFDEGLELNMVLKSLKENNSLCEKRLGMLV